MSTVIWKGLLETQGRVPQPFAAEIVRFDDGGIGLFRVGPDGVSKSAFSPHEVNGDAWLKALISFAESPREPLQAVSPKDGPPVLKVRFEVELDGSAKDDVTEGLRAIGTFVGNVVTELEASHG